jgi:hypothetical protein
MLTAWELGLTVLGATIVPDEDAGTAGSVDTPVEDRVRYADWVEKRDYLYAHIVMVYAGMEAGEKYVGAPVPKMHIDLGFVSHRSDYGKIAHVLIELAGPEEKDQLELGERARQYAERLVALRWEQIESLAETLVERETLDAMECYQVLSDL